MAVDDVITKSQSCAMSGTEMLALININKSISIHLCKRTGQGKTTYIHVSMFCFKEQGVTF